MNTKRILLTCCLLGLGAAHSEAVPPAKVAFEGGRIIPVVGEEIAKGTLLIEHGKITAVGKKVEIPYDAMVIDVSGKVLFPGMISPHTWRGLDRPNENLPVAPYLDVYDAIDPSSLSFEDALRDGVLAVHVIQGNNCVIGGVSRVVRPIGRTPDEMTIKPSIALKLSTSPKTGSERMSQMAAMREAFLELAYYLENLAEARYEAELKKENKEVDVHPEEARTRGRELIRDEDLDDKHRNLVKLKDGRVDAWIYCGAATDVAPAIETAKRNGFLEHTVLVLGTEAYRAVKELRAVGRPVVLPEVLVHQERDPITGELNETFIPKVIHDAGLLYALQPNPSSSLAERFLTYQAARCVRHGIPRRAALKAITLNPAKILGIDDQLGSLEVGKTGNVVILSGDPLDFNTWVEKAYIDGILAYDRAKDERLKVLLGLKKRQREKEKQEKDKQEEEEKKETGEQEEKKEEEPSKKKSTQSPSGENR
ncbi:MAG: amidohydrolase family protein [Gemmatimonadota bacterium]|nr:MAG: amidohydrolase family protein [Gemmatimonadota bacterium]